MNQIINNHTMMLDRAVKVGIIPDNKLGYDALRLELGKLYDEMTIVSSLDDILDDDIKSQIGNSEIYQIVAVIIDIHDRYDENTDICTIADKVATLMNSGELTVESIIEQSSQNTFMKLN